MRQADFVIHCGGNGTTYQAMSQGVPALVISFNNDQRINAWLIMRSKVGIPLSPSGLIGDQIRLAATKLVKDTPIHDQLQYFKNLLSGMNGPQRAAEEIMSFLNENS